MRSVWTLLARIPLNALPILLVVLVVGMWWVNLPAHPAIPTYPTASLREEHDYTVSDSGTASIRSSVFETTDSASVVRSWYMHEAPRLGWQQVDGGGMFADITYGTGSDGHI